jgi:hypothetical protein
LVARAGRGPPREGVVARDGVGEGVGVLTLALTGTGDMSAGCVPEEAGASDPEAVGAVGVCVGRGGVSGDGVVGRLWGAAEGGVNGERVRRAEAEVGDKDCTDDGNVCCMAVAPADDGGIGTAALRCMRGGRSGA